MEVADGGYLILRRNSLILAPYTDITPSLASRDKIKNGRVCLQVRDCGFI